jgi:hypothetical protein
MQTCPHCHRGIEIELKLSKAEVPSNHPAFVPPGLMRDIRVRQIRVAQAFSTTVDDMLIDRRSRALSGIRQIAMYVARRTTDASWTELAEAFQREHTTVQHGVTVVRERIAGSPVFAEKVAAIMASFEVVHRPEDDEPVSCTRLATTSPAPVALAAVGGE